MGEGRQAESRQQAAEGTGCEGCKGLRAGPGPAAAGKKECHWSFSVYLSYTPWMLWLLETQAPRTLQAGDCTPQASSAFSREGRPTDAAACNGRGDPPASRWPGKERVSRTAPTSHPTAPHFSPTSYHDLAPCCPYQHEVLVPLQLLHSPGQTLALFLAGLILQASKLLVALLFPTGFVLDLAQGDH